LSFFADFASFARDSFCLCLSLQILRPLRDNSTGSDIVINYGVIIGDVVKSRKLQDRRGVQKQLEDALSAVNQKFAVQVASRFLITLGDEFQGVLAQVGSLWDVVVRLGHLMHSVDIAFGLGVGPIITEIKEVALGMDGPAFHRARDALGEVKGRGSVAIKTGDENLDVMLGSTMRLLWVVRSEWTERQAETVELVQLLGSQTKAASKMDVSLPTVSKAIKTAHLHELEEVEGWLRQCLEAAGDGTWSGFKT
jgi:hypothetical protein